MNVTALRKGLAKTVDIPETVQVLMAPTEYNGSFGDEDPDEMLLFVRILAGPAGPATEDRVDELVDLVPRLIAADRQLGGLVSDSSVTRCSGHMPFPNETLGVQWTVRVLT